MEIEEPSARSSPAHRQGGCFPLNLFGCLPAQLRMFLPGTWQVIQDGTHLILMLGVLACAALVITAISSFWKLECFSEKSFFCAKEFLELLFILPCCAYFVRIIGQYDQKLQTKHAEARQQKENLARSFNELLSDMDGLLGKAAESSAGLAERSFESKRRDFQRFLERSKANFGKLEGRGCKGDSDTLFKQFRRFCINWLHVFEECSIDPISAPKRVVTEEELNRCTTIAEVCDLCLERLRVTEVRFISIQRDQDAQILKKNRGELKRLTMAPGLQSTQDARTIYETATRMSTELVSTSGGDAGGISWISCRSGQGCRYTSAGGEDGFPKELCMCCCRIVVLSKEHLLLLLGFVVGWVILALDVLLSLYEKREEGQNHPHPKHAVTVVLIVLAQISLINMLCRFEELDIIQQLEREVRGMQAQVDSVETQRKKMREFWNNAQQLTELWLYRTVPRLDLFKEIHSQLEDVPSEDLLVNISGANQHLEDLEHKLGELSDWRNDGELKVDAKKKFGKAINQLCQLSEFDEILVKLEEVTTAKNLLTQDGEPQRKNTGR